MKDFQLSKKKPKKFVKAKKTKPKDILVENAIKELAQEKSTSSDTVTPQVTNSHNYFEVFNNAIVSWKNTIKPVPLSKLRFIRRHKNIRKFLQKNESDLQLVLFPLILLMILVTLNVINSQMVAALAVEEFHASGVNTKLHPYPFVQKVATPEISANAAIIVDADSQVILFSKNPQLRFSMASTTKIMTALTGLDYYALDAILTIKSYGVEGSGLGLVPGDKFRFKDLLYAMMLPSANDAAQAIADNYPGGSDEFIKKMNEKAASLHLTKTHYADPSGLDDDGDYTTVVDLARLASHAITHPVFVDITSTRYKTINNLAYTRSYPLTNLNRLLGTNGVTGIKTGTTEGAGEVLVTSTVKNGHTYIIVVMQSQDRFTDTSVLMNFIEENVQYVSPSLDSLEEK
jgi:D-alanyl-D-alanine carboxypeptidase